VGGGQSVSAPPAAPQAPQQPNPSEVANATANAYAMFYQRALDTYISRLPDIVRTDTELRVQYGPTQRGLERQLSALDQRAQVQTGLQLEREMGGQRTLEGLRRQFEASPAGFALNRGMGDQLTRQFGQLYGADPYASVPLDVALAGTTAPVDYFGTIGKSLDPKIGETKT